MRKCFHANVKKAASSTSNATSGRDASEEVSVKTEGPLGIRIGVWLIVFGAVLACVLTISLSPRHTNQLTPDRASENLSHQESSNHETSSRRAGHIEFAPATYESGEGRDFDEAQLAVIEQMTQDRRTWWDSPR